MAERAPLLDDEADHPHEVVLEREGRRVVAMDSARYVDARNRDRDVVVPASYLGVLPARLMAPHRPRAVVGHDGCIGKDGAGIAGLWYLEALGIPAAAAEGMSAELGNGIDLYESGVISRVNVLAERCGVTEGMSVRKAAQVLLDNDPGDVSAGTKIRREVMATSDSGRQIVEFRKVGACSTELMEQSLLGVGSCRFHKHRYDVVVEPGQQSCLQQ